jgi:hypothetical protein
MLEPVAAHLRSQGIFLHRYLDDWLFRGPDPETVRQHTETALTLFRSLGLLVNLNKSDLTPRRQFVFLGMDIDLQHAWIRPTVAEVEKISSLVVVLRKLSQAPVRLILSLLGLLNHAAQFIQLGRLHIRPLQFYVKAHVPNLHLAIYDNVQLDWVFQLALDWWANPTQLRQGVPLHPPEPELTLTTDASLQGWGGFLSGHQASGSWSQQETLLHISLLELRAVHRSLQVFLPLVRNKTIQVLGDNTTAIAYIRNQGGTQSVSLFRETKELLLWCEANHITLRPFYLPGHLNSVADILSRSHQVLSTEWTLHPAVFRRLHQLIPQLDVDLFATRLNNRLPHFVSPCPDPQAWGVDALSIDWVDMTPYAFPPTKLIPEVLRKLRQSQVHLFLVAPAWPNQHWFPDLLNLLCDFPLQLPTWHRLLSQPLEAIFHQNPRLLALHVWPLSSLESERQDFLARLRSTQWPPGGSPLYDSTSLIGVPSPIGVLKGRSIHPRLLFTS